MNEKKNLFLGNELYLFKSFHSLFFFYYNFFLLLSYAYLIQNWQFILFTYCLSQVNLVEEFDILQIVGEGWFGKILLVEHKSTDTEMVLKALPKQYVGLKDFFREFHYGVHLGIHRNIVTTHNVAFETAGFYVFSQEYASLGDLTSNVSENGIGELYSKRVAKQVCYAYVLKSHCELKMYSLRYDIETLIFFQLAAAIEYIHTQNLVHRDIKLDNILVFKSDFSRIKLCDLGETRKINAMVRRRNEWLPYSPPEVLATDTDKTYRYENHNRFKFIH